MDADLLVACVCFCRYYDRDPQAFMITRTQSMAAMGRADGALLNRDVSGLGQGQGQGQGVLLGNVCIGGKEWDVGCLLNY